MHKNSSGYISRFTGFIYRNIIKPVLFLFPADDVHEWFLDNGRWLGQHSFFKKLFKKMWNYEDSILNQNLAGLYFNNPIGLAAGFDYEAKLTQILPAIGFGFGTIGTITNKPYEGNSRPMLGRLVKSKSLLVNKGFKNLGMETTLEKLKNMNFDYPVGISIGKTNSRNHDMTQEEAIDDIVSAFKTVELSPVPFGYYELNISCPNLHGSVTFYEPEKLERLLGTLKELNLSRPIFIKMPTILSDEETLSLLDVIVNFQVAGVIFGNLHKNRQDPLLVPEEVAKCGPGSFSGKPTEKRSNELIQLCFKKYGQQIKIIGCGGVFTAEDAYKKIKLGASLIQLITGMVFMGPQQIGLINKGLAELLKRDGYQNINEAVGTGV